MANNVCMQPCMCVNVVTHTFTSPLAALTLHQIPRAPPCIQGDQMRPQLSPSNRGTMSSKETEWLEQKGRQFSGDTGRDGGRDGGMGAEGGRGGDKG